MTKHHAKYFNFLFRKFTKMERYRCAFFSNYDYSTHGHVIPTSSSTSVIDIYILRILLFLHSFPKKDTQMNYRMN